MVSVPLPSLGCLGRWYCSPVCARRVGQTSRAFSPFSVSLLTVPLASLGHNSRAPLIGFFKIQTFPIDRLIRVILFTLNDSFLVFFRPVLTTEKTLLSSPVLNELVCLVPFHDNRNGVRSSPFFPGWGPESFVFFPCVPSLSLFPLAKRNGLSLIQGGTKFVSSAL